MAGAAAAHLAPNTDATRYDRIEMKRAAILWWGSFPYGQVTIGDYMSVVALCDALTRRGIAFDIVRREAAFEPIPSIAEYSSKERSFDPETAPEYAACAFVCGPLPSEWPDGRARLLAFSNARRIAVGASLGTEQGREHALRTFHTLLCRDGFGRAWMDMSLACNWPANLRHQREGIAVCWRGHEAFYGEICANAPVEAIAAALLDAEKRTAKSITTDIKAWPSDIHTLDRQFGDFDTMLTTRLHGTLLCLRNRTPFVSVDQQIGGGKVTAVARAVQWPLAIGVESLSFVKLRKLLHAALQEGWSKRFEKLRQRALSASHATVRTAADAIEEAVSAR
jgi:hypothetical protein